MSGFHQFSRYVIVGTLNTAIDFSLLNVLSISFDTYSGIPIIFFNSVAFSVVIVNSFLWNKYWTFRTLGGNVRSELIKFIAVSCGALALNTGIVYGVTTFIRSPAGISPLLWENFAKSVALGANILWNFFGFKFFVFYRHS